MESIGPVVLCRRGTLKTHCIFASSLVFHRYFISIQVRNTFVSLPGFLFAGASCPPSARVGGQEFASRERPGQHPESRPPPPAQGDLLNSLSVLSQVEWSSLVVIGSGGGGPQASPDIRLGDSEAQVHAQGPDTPTSRPSCSRSCCKYSYVGFTMQTQIGPREHALETSEENTCFLKHAHTFLSQPTLSQHSKSPS